MYSQASLAKVVPEFAIEVIKATVTQYFEDAGKLTVRNIQTKQNTSRIFNTVNVRIEDIKLHN